MTREDKLFAMNGTTLIMLADKLGVKVKCNRTRTQLKESKEAAIKRILAAEAQDQNDWEKKSDEEYNERKAKAAESDEKAEKAVNKKKKEEKDTPPEKRSETPAPGRNAQLEFDGRSQNICAWAKELGISANTLYGRIYKLGWPVEKAFTTPAKNLKHVKK